MRLPLTQVSKRYEAGTWHEQALWIRRSRPKVCKKVTTDSSLWAFDFTFLPVYRGFDRDPSTRNPLSG
jgi:hypothetical protein